MGYSFRGTSYGKTLVCGEAIWLWSRVRNNMGRTRDHSCVYWHNPAEQYGHDVGQERARSYYFSYRGSCVGRRTALDLLG